MIIVLLFFPHRFVPRVSSGSSIAFALASVTNGGFCEAHTFNRSDRPFAYLERLCPFPINIPGVTFNNARGDGKPCD